jgi:hypothetical protein
LPSVWSKTVGEDPISLYDVEMETGHTLVHYLYTREYQTLDTVVDSTLDACDGLKRALLVYIMVNNYNLPGLRELALRQIQDLCARLDIFDILGTIESDFVKLGPDTPVHAFLHEKAKIAFEKDHTVFAREEFLGCLDNAALRGLMLRCVMTLYSDKVSHIINTKKEACQRLDECDETIRDLSVEAANTEQYMIVQQEFLTPLANAHDSVVEERCSEEAFESETTSTEGFRTISRLSCSDSIEPPECLDEPAERFDQLIESLELPLVCEDEPPVCEEEPPVCEEEPPMCQEDFPVCEDGPPVYDQPVCEEETPACEEEPPVCEEDFSVCAESTDQKPCPYQALHILEGAMWKTCRPCRDFVEKVAQQLAGPGLGV